ncbi:hypothetical protein PMAYCL1PPCAC_28944, partial [Pristionchus mayeri]
ASNPFNRTLVPISLQCFDYDVTSDVSNNNILKTFMNCPLDASFCVKSYHQIQVFNGFSYLESRNCANGQICQ